MDDKRIAEIRARTEAATPGPWEWMDAYMMCHENPEVKVPFDDRRRQADRLFAAHARQDIPDLLDALEAARAEVVRLNIAFREADPEYLLQREGL